MASNRTLNRVILFASLAATGSLLAQSSGGDFEITRSSLDGGGGTATGGDFSLTASIAQPDADPQFAAGGGYLLAGGLWAKTTDHIFNDGFEGSRQP